MKKILYVGLDVYAELIAVAVAEAGRSGEQPGRDGQPDRGDPQAGQDTWD